MPQRILKRQKTSGYESRNFSLVIFQLVLLTIPLLISAGTCLALLCPRPLSAAEWSYSYDTRYATIYHNDREALRRFTKNIGGGVVFFSRVNLEKEPQLPKDRVDKIVENIETILDMRPKGLRFSIYIYPDYEELSARYMEIKADGTSPIAFYSHTKRAIYVSLDNITDGILAHEIAHAVISIYFVTPPPAKMQEILAKYVDMHLWE